MRQKAALRMFAIETERINAKDVAMALTSCARGVALLQGKFPFSFREIEIAFTIHLDRVAWAISFVDLFSNL